MELIIIIINIIGGYHNYYGAGRLLSIDEVMNTETLQWSTAANLPEPASVHVVWCFSNHL